MKNTDRFKVLLNKFIKDQLSPGEEKVLNIFSEQMQQDGISAEKIKYNLALRNKIKGQIDKNIEWDKPSRLHWWHIAAGILILIFAGYELLKTDMFLTFGKYVEVSTKHGECKTIWLSDSTQVVLNAESYLKYPESFKGKKERIVELAGEAYFQVFHDEHQPFVVHSLDLNTEVLGTKFNVSNYKNETPQVVVVSGKVKVSDTLSNSVVLTKNHRVHRFQDHFITDSVIGKDYTCWLQGKLKFKNASIQEVVNILNHHVKKKMVLDDSLKGFKKKITGNYKVENIHDILSSIEFICDIHSVVQNDTIKLFINN